MQQIREGAVFSDELLKEDEIDLAIHLQRNPNEIDKEDEDIELEDLEGQCFDSQGRPMFDEDDNSINYT